MKTAAILGCFYVSVLAALFGIVWGASSNSDVRRVVVSAPVQTIYVQNLSSFVSDAEVLNALPAFAAATHKDFAPIWHIDANLVFVRRGDIPKGAESITLVDKGNVPGALAYHEMVNGAADSIVFAGTSKYFGFSWTVGFTHELWEMLVEPPAGTGAVDTVQDGGGLVWAKEIADPVESDADGYNRPGANGKPIRISDFITEKWFGAAVNGPFDFMDHIQAPEKVDKGGYAQWWSGSSWVVVSNFRSARDRAFYVGEHLS